jgi:hypothetical protein
MTNTHGRIRTCLTFRQSVRTSYKKLKKGGLKRKCQKTTVLFVLPAAQLHYNRFLLATSLPLLRF